MCRVLDERSASEVYIFVFQELGERICGCLEFMLGRKNIPPSLLHISRDQKSNA